MGTPPGCRPEGRIALIALITIAVWIFVVLPLIYLPGDYPKMTLQDWAYVATIVSAAGFVVSICVALYQIDRARHVQKSAAASQLWDTYLGRALNYPHFAYPPNFTEKFDFSAATFDGEKEEFERYEWFVSAYLQTADETFAEYDASHHRVEMVFRNANYHRAYLKWRRTKNMPNDYIDSLSPRLKQLISRVVQSDSSSS